MQNKNVVRAIYGTSAIDKEYMSEFERDLDDIVGEAMPSDSDISLMMLTVDDINDICRRYAD